MYHFLLTIAVTANTEEERESWVQYFCGLLPGVTIIPGIGDWEGCREPSITIQHWTDRLGDVLDILPAVETYRVGANQVAAFVTVQGPYLCLAAVLPDDCKYFTEEVERYLDSPLRPKQSK